MRIIIYTGKGGVGKTSVAAASGVKLSQAGVKTLVISTDLAHSLADSFDISLNHEPTPVIENLWAEEINPQSELEERWDRIYNYMVQIFKVMGIKEVFAEELNLLPGIEELFSLLEIYRHYQKGEFDVLILDCPPTASTLRLLSLFDVVGWYMERFFKIERRSTKVLRKFTDTLFNIPLPEDDVYETISEIYERMAVTKEILANPKLTSIRLVMNPEQMVINESQRAYTYLNLYGFNVDSVIVNKVLPDNLSGDFYSSWIKRQKENLEMIREIFTPLEIFTLPLLSDELKGLKNLEMISKKLYDERDPLDCFNDVKPMELEKEGDNYHFKVYVPFLEKKKFELYQKGIVLIITVGSYKRKLVLPQILSNKEVKKARYKNQYLHLYF
ncbi:MAG: ArsA family ATPase [Halanaerobiales bacterium]|nr:ArsA family ATPase [Halanaerobiales bacterium]